MVFSGIVSIIKITNGTIESVGTGFFTKSNGFLLTCYHVLKKAGCYNVGNTIGFMFEGQTQVLSARLDEFDPIVDVAILYSEKNQPKGYSLLGIGNESDYFDTLGFPEGSLIGVTEHPSFDRQAPDGLIELKCANSICRGFSGAPLLDKNGAVAGMIRIIPQIIRESGSMLNVARAIPVKTIIKKFPSLLSQDSNDSKTVKSCGFVDECERVITPKEDTSSTQIEMVINNIQGDQYNGQAVNRSLGRGNTFNAPIYMGCDGDKK